MKPIFQTIISCAVVIVLSLGFAIPASATVQSVGQKPAQVKNLQITASAVSTLALSWKRAKRAKGYQIFRANSKNGAYKKVQTVRSAKITKWKNTGLKADTAYWYKIRAYRGKKQGKFSVKKAGRTKLATVVPNVPPNKKEDKSEASFTIMSSGTAADATALEAGTVYQLAITGLDEVYFCVDDETVCRTSQRRLYPTSKGTTKVKMVDDAFHPTKVYAERTVTVTKGVAISIAGQDIQLGDRLSTARNIFGAETESHKTIYGYQTYVFAADASHFTTVGVKESRIVAIYTAASDFVFQGNRAIQTGIAADTFHRANSISPAYTLNGMTDDIESNALIGIYLTPYAYTQQIDVRLQWNALSEQEKTALTDGIAKETMYAINALRMMYHARDPLTEDIVLSEYATAHSRMQAQRHEVFHSQQPPAAETCTSASGALLPVSIEMVSNYYNSTKGHRGAILDPDWVQMGFGVYGNGLTFYHTGLYRM